MVGLIRAQNPNSSPETLVELSRHRFSSSYDSEISKSSIDKKKTNCISVPRRCLPAASPLLLLLARPPPAQGTNLHFHPTMEGRHSLIRQFSIFNEFSKNLKGEASSNPEFQKSVKELNEKLGVVKEDLKVRTKRTAEKLYKSVDDVWTEAEAKSRKVSTNVKEKLSAAKEEVSENIKEKLSAATEEVKETFGLGSKPSSGSSNTSTESASTQTSQTSTEESLLGKFKSAFSSGCPKFSSAFQTLKLEKVSDIAKKGYNIVRDELTSDSVRTKRRIQYDASHKSSEVRSMRTDIVVTPTKKSRLGQKWEEFKKKMEGVPLYKKVKGASEPVVTNVVNKGQEIAEDVREIWETSDHPVVHKIQDLNETVFGETATGLSFKEIRRRDPYFSLPDFVAEVQEMVRPVLNAYLKGDVETLKKYCSPEVIERCKGERQAYESQDMYFDSKILHISEVDVRETKMMGSTPIIIIGFQTQQIYCVRNKEGSIKDGGQDTIHTIYYAWAMQQMDMKELGEEEALFPVWKLREMQQIGVQSLI